MAKNEHDTDLVRTLAELLQDTGLTELEYETGGLKIRLSKAAAQAMVAAAPAVAAPAAVAAAPAPAAAPAADHPGTVRSPMVGTVYAAAEPGAKPFISVGDTVRQGQTLLIIEAMKVMNPLPAPKAGKIVEIFVRDAQPVEFGEPLVVIE